MRYDFLIEIAAHGVAEGFVFGVEMLAVQWMLCRGCDGARRLGASRNADNGTAAQLSWPIRSIVHDTPVGTRARLEALEYVVIVAKPPGVRELQR
ncbi:hypothetical protein GCM10027432_02210 [Lysobacter fragariae]